MILTHNIGRRKNSIARVYLKEGTGIFKINGREISDYFSTKVSQYKIRQAFIITETKGLYDVIVNVYGGGITGQAEAIRLGISKALVSINKENKSILRSMGLLTRDARMVERKKFGQKKARKRFQFSKR